MAKGKNASVKVIDKSGPTGFVLFVAWIGALVYFVQQSFGFWGFVLAVLKSFVWPAYVLYHIMQVLRV